MKKKHQKTCWANSDFWRIFQRSSRKTYEASVSVEGKMSQHNGAVIFENVFNGVEDFPISPE